MDLLSLFSNYLLSQDNPASALTVKNYLADIRKFFHWFEEEFARSFTPSSFTPQVIQLYESKSEMAPSSLERSMSTLRKFAGFLMAEAMISLDPFKELAFSDSESEKKSDPWRLDSFRNHLYNTKSSHLTIKNYIIDVRQFLSWLPAVVKNEAGWEIKEAERNIFEFITIENIEEYKKRLLDTLQLSPLSINRKLSSLRRYFNFAQAEGLLSFVPYVGQSEDTDPLPTLSELKTQSLGLADDNGSLPEMKKGSYSSFPPLRLIQKVIFASSLGFDLLIIGPLAKLASELHLLAWILSGRKLFAHVSPSVKRKIKQPFLPVKNIQKEFYAPLSVSLSYLPFYKRIWHHARHSRPKWYKRYHDFPIVHYLHFAVLMIVMTGIGMGLYRGFYLSPQKDKQVLAALDAATPLKILSFQGRLTDATDNPITDTKLLRFIVYNNETSSGSARLWEEVRRVSPDTDGIFSVLLGSDGSGENASLCNSHKPPSSPAIEACGIPQSVFRDNTSLWLGITVESDAELSPRQQLATVDYAGNAEVLQGLAPTTDTGLTGNANAVLALNSRGSLVIPGSAATTFQASDGQFKLTAQALTLTTNIGSAGNVILDPEGKIDLRKGLVNDGNVNSLSTAAGAVEVDDLFAVLATSSGQSAVTIDQTGTGPIISASASGSERFTVNNTGAGTFASDLAVNGSSITSTQTTFSLLNTTVSTLSFAQAATALTIGSSSGTTTIRNALTNTGLITANGGLTVASGQNTTLAGFSNNGGVLYTNGSGVVAQTSVGSNGQCLQSVGQGTPVWGSCNGSGGNINWTVGNGAIFPNQASVLDILIGADATSSALVKFGATQNSDSFFSSGGNLGIGTTTPGFGLHVVRSSPGVVARFTDTNGSCDIDPTSTALLCTSDASLKQDVEPIGNALGKVLALKGIRFKWNNQTDEESHIGFIAQEVESVIPELVKTDPKTRIKSVNYIGFVPILVNAIKEQQEQIASLAVKDYITQAVQNILNIQYQILNTTVVSPIAQADRIHTNLITPLSSDTVVVDGKLVILNDSKGSEDSSHPKDAQNDILLDVQGSASIAGTLRAKKIIADEIEGLQQASSSATYVTNITNIYQNTQNTQSASDSGNQSFSESDSLTSPTASDSSEFSEFSENIASNTQLPSGASLLSPLLQTEYTNVASVASMLSYVPNLQADFATFHQGVMVFGPTSLADVSVANQLAVGGNLILAENSINVLGADLEIQPLRQGNVSFMSGLVGIDTEGNFTVAGNANFAKDVSVKGTLSARFISPIPDEDLVIRLAGHPRESEDLIPGQAGNDKGQLVVQNASGSGVLKINQLGDLIASGSGTFNNLIANGLKVIRGVQADTSITETVASSSAGTAIITRGQLERTIFSPFVKTDSLIYITPTSDTAGLTPYIARQTAEDPENGTSGSFTIQIPSSISKDIKINWWIVN